jgi:DNA-binding GntR family transcriptional regulator
METKLENRSVKDYIYDRIKQLLENNEFVVGEKINKNDLASKFNISLTPINDALNRLVGENYLVQYPRKGFFVKEFSPKELCDLFEIRAGLEGIAVRLCCERASDEDLNELIHSFDIFENNMQDSMIKQYTRIDKDFHQKIIFLAHNPLISQVRNSLGFLNRTYQKGLIKPMKDSLLEHNEIIAGLKLRDGKKAQIAMEIHLLGSRDRILNLLKKSN